MVMVSRKNSSPAFLLALFTLLITACGGSSSNSNNKAPGDAQSSLAEMLQEPLGEQTACPALELSLTEGIPGTPITLRGLPSSMGDIALRVISEDETGKTRIAPLFVQANSEPGEANFVAPVHPSGSPEGGEVQLEPGDGDTHCPALSFTIKPLPDAPADYPRIITLNLEGWVDAVLRKTGLNPDLLLEADPDTLPAAQLGFWLAKQFVSGDDEGALPALAERAIEEEDPLLARLLKGLGLEQAIADALIDLNQYPDALLAPNNPQGRSAALLVRGHANSRAQTSSRSTYLSTSSADCGALSFPPNRLLITSAADLSERLLAGKSGDLLDDPAIGQVMGSLSLAETFDYIDRGRAGPVMDYGGTGMFVMSTLKGARQALEPQRVSDFTVNRARSPWVEDRPQDDFLFWDGAKVKAEGEEFNLTKTTLESLIEVMGMVPGPIGTGTTIATTVAPQAIDDVLTNITEGSCFRIEAPEYGPINVDDAEWTRADVYAGNSIEIDENDHRQYRGVDIGVSTLRIYLNEQPFALSIPRFKDFNIAVEEIRISVDPGRVRVKEPGEVVQINATAPNATPIDTSSRRGYFSATLPAGAAGSFVSQQEIVDHYEVIFKTPESYDSFPTQVLFTANHPTLPVGSLPRERLVTIDTGGDLRISPRNACVNNSGSLDFSADISGFGDEDEVVWTTTAGSINPTSDTDARFNAPAANGTVTITATATADNSVSDSVTISVSSSCIRKAWWPMAMLTLDGNGNYSTNEGSCPNLSDPERQILELAPVDGPTSLAAMLAMEHPWYDHSEKIEANMTHSSTHHHYVTADSQCYNKGLHGAHDGKVEFQAKPDGTLLASFDSKITTECEIYADGTRVCSNGGGMLGKPLTTGAYALEINEARQFTLEGELSCGNQEGNITIDGGLRAMVTRYVGGEPWLPPVPPNTQPFKSGISTPSGGFMTPMLFNLECGQSDSVDFVLDAPPAGEMHQVLIQITGPHIISAGQIDTGGVSNINATLRTRLTPQ